MIWYIVRHAEKDPGDFFNPRLRHQDQPISLKGRQDAQKLCAFFAEKQISAIYVSSYQRTRQTIEEVAGRLQLAPLVDARLNEIDNGCFEGLSDQELHQEYPDVWTAYRERKCDFRFPGGETGAEAQQRIINFLAETLPQRGAENIILVSHDGLIRLLMCHILNIPVFSRWNFRVDTCGIMEVTYQRDFKAWKLIRFNQTCL
ncbi:MAG: histidine phosphatase family protein [Chloroflexi bacterium]|nr:histidine phosphatase family protein [Chloroflexota bacterium]